MEEGDGMGDYNDPEESSRKTLNKKKKSRSNQDDLEADDESSPHNS